jgi:hypothetical protein
MHAYKIHACRKDSANHRPNVDGEECYRRGRVGPVGDKIGSPVQGEPGVSLTQGPIQAHAAQGSVTPGPEQGELGANFSYLGRNGKEGNCTVLEVDATY